MMSMACGAGGKGNILVVDDTPLNLDLLSEILAKAGYHVRPAKSGSMALMSAQSVPPDLILLDIMMAGMDGYEVCRRLKEAEQTRDVPVVFISALEEAVDKVRGFDVGGVDFISKPFQVEEVLARVRTHLALRQAQLRLEEQNAQLEKEIAERRRTESELSKFQEHMTGVLEKKLLHPEVFQGIVTKSEKMQSVFQYIEALACSSEPVLVTGESGVGKELFAKAIHDVSQANGAWVPVSIAGLDDNVFSDTLFGHVKGAFTGADRARPGIIEEASGGTLFLDEIGDLSPVSQVKLLRMLQEKEYLPLGSDRTKKVNARVVVATNVNLAEKQQAGAFRRDLYFRLCTHHVEIPPLRERKEDIPLLLEHFLQEAAREMGKKVPTFPKELPILLANYSFPGNVRELRSIVFNAVSVHTSRMLSMDLFKKYLSVSTPPQNSGLSAPESPLLTFHEQLPTLRQAADLLALEALRRTNGNQSLAANLLGITQPALSSRLKRCLEKPS